MVLHICNGNSSCKVPKPSDFNSATWNDDDDYFTGRLDLMILFDHLCTNWWRSWFRPPFLVPVSLTYFFFPLHSPFSAPFLRSSSAFNLTLTVSSSRRLCYFSKGSQRRRRTKEEGKADDEGVQGAWSLKFNFKRTRHRRYTLWCHFKSKMASWAKLTDRYEWKYFKCLIHWLILVDELKEWITHEWNSQAFFFIRRASVITVWSLISKQFNKLSTGVIQAASDQWYYDNFPLAIICGYTYC